MRPLDQPTLPRPDLLDVLEARFGFRELRPGQRAVMDALLSGHSALAVFPTGGGKSLCYQLPALLLDGVTIVISPLIALMKDQIDFLSARDIAAVRLDSSLSADDAAEAHRDLRSGKTKLLYVAPERFVSERFMALLKELKIALFAVDEAHCISEWGHNFRPDYLRLADTARALGVPRVLALTATATPGVVRDVCATFGIREEHTVITGFYRPNLELRATAVTAPARDRVLIERLRSRPPGSTIVYVTLQKTAEHVADKLAAAGLPARAYHAGMEAAERARVQDDWMQSDRGIVVATIAFGMGIDKPDVRYVDHYNLPKSLESYSQEIGRAGRDQAHSVVEVFVCGDDLPVLENFAYGDTPTEDALHGVVGAVLAAPQVELGLHALGTRHDVRPLVLRTALTYLELMGAVRQLTPYYAGYEVRLHRRLEEVIASVKGEPARFLEALFGHAKKGRVLYAVDPAAAAAALEQPRERVVRALEYLERQGLAELKASDIRHRFVRVASTDDAGALVGELLARFAKREDAEIARVRQVIELLTSERCHAAALAAYFGERLDAACGRCTFCRTGVAVTLPEAAHAPPMPVGLDVAAFTALRAAHAGALGHPRQAARFLCGLSSPATTQAKLARDPLFGVLITRRFAEVLDWCAGLSRLAGAAAAT
ncbi:RecQ family ATP-dependent DNA helicase [Sorangium sp. So ce1000]|uniref:RecQ family ATP-dependent DNA helicase n=1 Tax=Sorangium sp. So ce1000 TaxID=3133325 RepID=UPI003F634B90